jgi:hypothetical protein
MADNYHSIWAWDGAWTFYGYAPGAKSADQVTRALNRLGVYASRGRQWFYHYPSRWTVGSVRWTKPPWFSVYAYSGMRKLSWGHYYREPFAFKVMTALQRMDLIGVRPQSIVYSPETGAFSRV